jgi:Fe-S-cluster containining protein
MHDIIEQYRSLLETVDSWFQQTQQQFSQEIYCRSGCSGCCRGFFDITLLDAALVFHGYKQLASKQQEIIHGKAVLRLADLQQRWPDFKSPFLLNGMPDSEWTSMPEEDETPCPFLDDDDRCLIYLYRPMTCRLHGLPNIDFSGESFSDLFCSLNFKNIDPLLLPQIRWEFRQTFSRELDLFREYTTQLLGRPVNELDTLLPLVPLIDFDRTDWQNITLYRLSKPVEQA